MAAGLMAKGVKLTDTRGVVTAVEVPDLAKLSDDDFKNIARLPGVQKLSFGRGLTDQQLTLLAGASGVTAFITNGSELDDAGVARLKQFEKLTALTFFHPGKNFHGPGLAELAALQSLQSLTVAGSSAFGNEGVAAIAKLSHLKSLRLWHINADAQGMMVLKSMTGLNSIVIGQRLSFQPPPMLNDETVGLLLEMKSLETISLGEARLTLAALSRLKGLPSLKQLTLDRVDLSPGDLEKLRNALGPVQIKSVAVTPDATRRIDGLFGR